MLVGGTDFYQAHRCVPFGHCQWLGKGAAYCLVLPGSIASIGRAGLCGVREADINLFIKPVIVVCCDALNQSLLGGEIHCYASFHTPQGRKLLDDFGSPCAGAIILGECSDFVTPVP